MSPITWKTNPSCAGYRLALVCLAGALGVATACQPKEPEECVCPETEAAVESETPQTAVAPTETDQARPTRGVAAPTTSPGSVVIATNPPQLPPPVPIAPAVANPTIPSPPSAPRIPGVAPAGGTANACGGSIILGGEPGQPCGEGGQGVWSCAGPNAVVCEMPTLATICHIAPENPTIHTSITIGADGIAEHLAHGDYYGPCLPTPGYAPVAPTSPTPANACGGIAILPAQPGQPCGQDGTGLIACAGPDAVTCQASNVAEATPTNACGGTAELDLQPGDACGVANLGTCECDGPDRVVCREPSQVTLCHVPPGNPANEHNITVGAPAVEAHLAHGDYLGECNRAGSADDDSSSSHPRLRIDDSARPGRGRGRGRDR